MKRPIISQALMIYEEVGSSFIYQRQLHEIFPITSWADQFSQITEEEKRNICSELITSFPDRVIAEAIIYELLKDSLSFELLTELEKQNGT
jgi:hypothetical protein